MKESSHRDDEKARALGAAIDALLAGRPDWAQAVQDDPEVLRITDLIASQRSEVPIALETRVRRIARRYEPEKRRVAIFNPKHRLLHTFVRLAGVVVAAVLLVAVVLAAVPQTRLALASWLGFTFEKGGALPPVVERIVSGLDYGPDSALPAGWPEPFEALIIELPEDRWQWIEQGFAAPQPDDSISLSEGGMLSVPTYLPEGYRWIGVVLPKRVMPDIEVGEHLPSDFLMSMGRQSWWGGGHMPAYEMSVNYLIGGDQANRLVLLSRFQSDDSQALAVNAYQAGRKIGVVIQPSEKQQGLTFLVGESGDIGGTAVGDIPARYYSGTWNSIGEWQDDVSWTNLVWHSGNVIYHLAGQDMDIEELSRIAESLP